MRLLGKFISVREPNIRYLGLMTMSRIAQLVGGADYVKKYQATVLVSLKDDAACEFLFATIAMRRNRASSKVVTDHDIMLERDWNQ
jgi:hypothetical protein